MFYQGLLKFAKRNTFLIDPKGKIAKLYVTVGFWHKVDIQVHAIKTG